MKKITLGLIAVLSFVAGAAKAAPTYEQVGVYYVDYVESSFYASADVNFPSSTALEVGLPFGTNVGYYGYFFALAQEQSDPYYDQATVNGSYNNWLGKQYAYENYQYPEYSAQLESYYSSVANYSYEQGYATANWVYDYYGKVAQYYYELIYPKP